MQCRREQCQNRNMHLIYALQDSPCVNKTEYTIHFSNQNKHRKPWMKRIRIPIYNLVYLQIDVIFVYFFMLLFSFLGLEFEFQFSYFCMSIWPARLWSNISNNIANTNEMRLWCEWMHHHSNDDFILIDCFLYLVDSLRFDSIPTSIQINTISFKLRLIIHIE